MTDHVAAGDRACVSTEDGAEPGRQAAVTPARADPSEPDLTPEGVRGSTPEGGPVSGPDGDADRGTDGTGGDDGDGDGDGGDDGDGDGDGDPQTWRSAARWAAVVLIAVVILSLVRLFVVQSFVIPSPSMEPALSAGDRVLVSRLDYRLGDIRRGDLIVFNGDGVFDPPRARPASLLGRSGQAAASLLGIPVGERDYVKRVIGLPGDRVVCCDAQGRITVNGVALTENYLPEGTVPSLIRFDVVVPPERLWVMGDNRSVSGDSRAHLGDPGGGTVPLDQVVGRVVAVWWPFGSATGVGRVDAARVPTAQ